MRDGRTETGSAPTGTSARDPLFPLLPEVYSGETADVYFLRTRTILAQLEIDPHVGVSVFSRRGGTFCGLQQVVQILTTTGFDGELWSVHEGEPIDTLEPAMMIRGRYCSFGLYETAMLGILASCTAWATAAQECVEAATGTPIVSYGARHVHPNVAGIMDYSAIVGGCVTCSSPQGAALAGTQPSGTMPHALVLIVGDTLAAARAFDQVMEEEVPRIVLVDTFQDEAVESIRVAEALGERLRGVRLDTPVERGGVTPALVREVRSRLNGCGFEHVEIAVSGGMSPERIREFRDEVAPVDTFGVGSYISGARPIDYTADIREIEGKATAKRGRIPGLQASDRLERIL